MSQVELVDRLDFDLRPYDELDRDELYAILWLRNLVFVVGQKITAEPEVDGHDPVCAHAMVWDGERLLGTARIFTAEHPLVIGRVAVHPEVQGRGVGTWMMWRLQEWLGRRPAELHAQAHLEAWYTGLGWRRHGEPFDEAGIPHVTMRWCWD